MSRLLVALRFEGTAYHGWQVQPNGVTVQQRVQEALEALLGFRPDVTGCSRTDAGVHAECFCFHTDVETTLPPERLPQALNAHLPEDIAAFACLPVSDDFHARYSCRGKQYVYRFYDAPCRDPFLSHTVWESRRPLDEERMRETAVAFLGTHDFSAFCASGSSVEDKTRTVTAVSVEREGPLVTFTVAADGFLYNMVRIMAGTLFDASCGDASAESVSSALATGRRELAGRTLPAKGLCLQRVFYDEEGWPWH